MAFVAKDAEEVGFPIGKIIRQLMEYNKMSEADLCRGVNLPQTTINRLLSGQTSDPRISTLVMLAQFFEISLEQILGQESITLNSYYKKAKGCTIPVIEWGLLSEWFRTGVLTDDRVKKFVKTERVLHEGSFAVKTPLACSPVFGDNSLLLMDRLLEPQVKEGQVVLLERGSEQPCLRYVLQDGDRFFLKRLFAPFDIVPVCAEDVFLAYVIEARKSDFVI